jgi:hypothetical protein
MISFTGIIGVRATSNVDLPFQPTAREEADFATYTTTYRACFFPSLLILL